MVEFILPDSTTAFKKMPLCQREGPRLHFGTPLKEAKKAQTRRCEHQIGAGDMIGAAPPAADPREYFVAQCRAQQLCTSAKIKFVWIPDPFRTSWD